MSALADSGRARILLVEDDANDAEIIRRCFDRAGGEGAEILHARTLAEGMRIAASGEADLALLDLDLPDSGGLETLERINLVALCPVIVISGNRHPALAEEALKRRAYEVIPKDELDTRTLERFVRLAAAQGEAERSRRDSETQFRNLVELSPDAILVHEYGEVRFANSACARLLGEASPVGLVGRSMWSIVDPRDHDTLRDRFRLLAAGERLPFIDLRWIRADGVPVDIEVAASPIEYGGRAAVQVVARDATRRKTEERLLKLELDVMRILATAADAGRGLRAVLRTVCESQGWESGRYWWLDPATGTLHMEEAWAVDQPEVRHFNESARGSVMRRGEGLAAQVMRSGEPICVADVNLDQRMKLGASAREIGIRSCFMFPVMDGERIVGLISIWSRSVLEPGARLLHTAQAIGLLVGQFLQRRAAERELKIGMRRKESIARLGEFAVGETNVDELFAAALEALRKGGADVASVMERLPETGEFLVRAAQGEGTEGAVGRSAKVGAEAKWPSVVEGGHAVTVDAAYLRSRPQGKPWSKWLRAMASGVYVPIKGESGLFAALCMYSGAEGAFDTEDVAFAEAIGNILSTAVRRLQAERRVAHLAQFDGLTGLPNRALLEDRLSQAIAHSRRKGRHVGVLYVDLDRMKLVNDSLGHQVGDALIRDAAARLQGGVRAGDTVGRLSGDEFAVVLPELALPDDAAIAAHKIVEAMALPFALEGGEAYVTASIGIAAFPEDGSDAATLLRNADMAMYRAKEAGRNGYCFFTSEMNARTVTRVQLNTDLRRALERGEFELYYQPKVDLAGGALRGLEALLRWNHPARGLVSPLEFIPVLEDSGLIVPVGDWVLREACAQVARWQAAGLKAVPVAVNLSAKQFRRGDLEASIRQALARADVAPDLLEMEITESHLMESPDEAIRILHALRNAGLRISVDDFGTGYSSLAYLARFPLSALKIDRAFVKSVDSDPTSAAIVRAVINMAQNLRMDVVAEGVETEQQAKHLRLYGCHQAQGFLFGRPQPAAATGGRLAARG